MTTTAGKDRDDMSETEANVRIDQEAGHEEVVSLLRAAARHPHKGPNDTDASMLLAAAVRLRGGYEPGGSWTKQTVARVIELVASLIEDAPAPAGDSGGEEIGGDECGDLLPGDERLPLSIGAEDPSLYADILGDSGGERGAPPATADDAGRP